MKEISVFLKNVPGQLAGVAETLSSQNINIRGMTVTESEMYSIVRIICDNTDKAVEALEEDYDVGTGEVLEVNIENKPGSLAKLAKILGTKEINIEYCYVALSAQGDSTVLIVKVNDPAKARAALTENSIPFR